MFARARLTLWDGLPALALLLLSVAFAVALPGKVTIAPAAPVVPVGTTLRFKANAPVKWSLAPGSLGTIDPDGVYHAPASISVHNTMGGCQILPNDHIFNTRIDSLPVHPNSKAWMPRIPATQLAYGPSWGINIADAQTPRRSMHFFYSPQNDGAYELVPWPYLKEEGGVFADPHSDVDRHVVTIDRDTCNIFELYNDYKPGTNDQCPTCTAQSGAHYSSLSFALPHGSTDAAGLLLAPLTLRLDEIRAGAIRHALRLTLQNSKISPSLVWPATANAGAWGFIPYGTRFRLKSDFDISRYSPLAQVLLKQLKEYGFFLADGGFNWDVDASTDVTEDRAVMAALGEISGSHVTSSLEIVDESPLMSSAASGEIKPDNGYIKPDSYAEVIATDSRNPLSTGRARIALQGVTIGFPDPALWIQSGVTKKLVAWVNGTSNKTLTWSMSPTLGRLTPDGVYTAPAVSRPTTTLITATSVADSQSKAALTITVIPPGAIRIDVGDASRAPGTPNRYAPDYGPDSEGHMWWQEQAGEVSSGVVNDDYYAQSWPKGKDINLYYTSRYSWGDMTYRFMVPNGQYKVNLLLAQPGCNGTYAKHIRAPIHLEAQGQIVRHYFDMGLPIHYACDTPEVVSIPALVTDESLYFCLRRVTVPGDARPSPLLNAFSIESDPTPAHLAIDPADISTVTTGGQIQFDAVGWYMSNAVKWTLRGPGSLSSTGLYTAPNVPPASPQSVTIEAHSSMNPGLTAAVKLMLEAGPLVLSPASVTLNRSLSQQIHATIGDLAYSNLTWSITPAVGSINAGGVYKAPDTLARDTRVTVRAESRDVPGKSATAVITVKATPDPIRIYCGDGPEFRDAEGNLWATDYGSNGGMSNRLDVPIARASRDMLSLYQSSRYVYEGQTLEYHFELPNGRYRVTLKFADYSFDTPGHHVFDVEINGKRMLSNFDANAVYGPRVAVDKEFDVSVNQKSIRIDFIGRKGGAIINGIQIVFQGAN